MENKKTIADLYNEILNGYDLSEEHKTFITERIEQSKKKSVKDITAKEAKKAKQNALKAKILADMKQGEAYTITEMIESFPSCKHLACQRVSAMVSALVREGAVTRVEEKRKAYFFLP